MFPGTRSLSGVSVSGIPVHHNIKFGGGGHNTASGCTVAGKIEDVEKMIAEEARKMIDTQRKDDATV